MIRARTSAAIASQMRGANSTKVGRDLAEVVHHRVGLFDEVDLHPAQQRFAERVDLLHDPRQRQHRDIFVVRPLRIERQIGRAMAQQARRPTASRAWDAPSCRRWCTGSRPRRPASHPPDGRTARARARRARARAAPARSRGHQPRVGVFAHAARVRIDDVAQLGTRSARPSSLSTCSSSSANTDLGVAGDEQIGDLLVERVAVEAEAHGADRMRGDLAGDPVRPVVADQRDDVAALDARAR